MFSLVLSLIYIPLGKESVIFIILAYFATLAAVFLCVAAARWRLVCIELCVPFTMLFRSLALYLLARHTHITECIPSFLDTCHRQLALVMLLADLITLRPNFFLTALIVTPLQLIIGALTKTARLHNSTQSICPATNAQQVGFLLATFPALLPLLFGVYLQTYNEARLFLVTENSAKQQQRMLEIFEKQEDGVVVLQKATVPEDPSKKDNKDVKILFTNNAFTGIVQAQDVCTAVESQIFLAQEDEEVMRVNE
jgi:hypothetical protein